VVVSAEVCLAVQLSGHPCVNQMGPKKPKELATQVECQWLGSAVAYENQETPVYAEHILCALATHIQVYRATNEEHHVQPLLQQPQPVQRPPVSATHPEERPVQPQEAEKPPLHPVQKRVASPE